MGVVHNHSYLRVDTVYYRTGGKFWRELIIVSLETVWWAFCTCEGAFKSCLCQCDHCSMASEGRFKESDRAAHIHKTNFLVENKNKSLLQLKLKLRFLSLNNFLTMHWNMENNLLICTGVCMCRDTNCSLQFVIEHSSETEYITPFFVSISTLNL